MCSVQQILSFLYHCIQSVIDIDIPLPTLLPVRSMANIHILFNTLQLMDIMCFKYFTISLSLAPHECTLIYTLRGAHFWFTSPLQKTNTIQKNRSPKSTMQPRPLLMSPNRLLPMSTCMCIAVLRHVGHVEWPPHMPLLLSAFVLLLQYLAFAIACLPNTSIPAVGPQNAQCCLYAFNSCLLRSSHTYVASKQIRSCSRPGVHSISNLLRTRSLLSSPLFSFQQLPCGCRA